MAIAEVGGGSQRASAFGNLVDSLDKAYPGDVTAGSLLICGGFSYSSPSAPASIAVTDTRGTSYTVVSFAVGTVERGFIGYGIAPSSGANTVTVNPSTASDYISYSIDEFSGVDSAPLSVNGGNAVGFGTTVDPTINTVTAGELIVGCMGYDGATTTIAPGSGYTEIGEHEDNSSDEAHALEFKIAGAPDAYVVRWTLGANKDWQVMTLSFKEAGPEVPNISWHAPAGEYVNEHTTVRQWMMPGGEYLMDGATLAAAAGIAIPILLAQYRQRKS